MKKILLIEDDPDQQKMYGRIFRKSGYKFLEALNGKQGIKTAKAEKPDLILLDLLMYGFQELTP